MKQSARYGIVGSGWRSDFFLRLAALMPERFEVTGLVTRSADKGAALSEKRLALRFTESARTRRPVTVGTQPWAS